MKHRLLRILFLTSLATLWGCDHTNQQKTDEKQFIDIAPERAELQKAKDLEKKILQDAEDQRKVIELQTK